MKKFISIIIVIFIPSFLFSWEVNIVDDTPGILARSSLALDRNGNPHIAYVDGTNGKLKYAKWVGNSFQTEIIDNIGTNVRTPSIDIDLEDNIAIAYDDNINHDLKCARWTGSSWYTVIVDSEGDVGGDCSLAFDKNGEIHISYSGFSPTILKYAKSIGTNWFVQTIDSGTWSSIAVDSNNCPHISYYGSLLVIKYAKWTETGWSTQTVESGVYLFGYRTSIDLDSNNNPHIVFTESGSRDPPGPGPLTYAKWTGVTWSKQIVKTYGGEGLSIRIDSYNKPHIAFAGYSPNSIKCANFNGDTWEIETVESGGEALFYPSLRLGPYDEKCIAYEYFAQVGESEIHYAITRTYSDPGKIGKIKIVVPQNGGVRGTINPNSGELIPISFKGSEAGKYTLRVFNLLGEQVGESIIEETNSPEGWFDWIPGDLASGVYIIHIEGPGGFKVHKKIPVLR